MATQENIQRLIQIRNARLQAASEARDVDALMKWQAADTTFTDKGAPPPTLDRDDVLPSANCIVSQWHRLLWLGRRARPLCLNVPRHADVPHPPVRDDRVYPRIRGRRV
ncbi:hypothetical protein MAJ_08691, partial [Metarhizium majus ARSEF 297]